MASCEAALGSSHMDTVPLRHRLAHAFRAAKDFYEAIPLFESNVRICERVFGYDHLVTLRRRSSWANCHYAAGDYPEAARLFGEILQDRERMLGASHPDTRRSLANSLREAARGAAA